MEAGNLHMKLCKGVERPEDDDGFRAIEKVLAPFLRTLKKRKHEKADVLPPDDEELYLKKDTKELLERLQSGFGDALKLRTLLNETAELLKMVTKSKSVNLYLADYNSGELILCPKYVKNPRFVRKYAIGTYLAAHVAHTKEYVISSDILGDVRFPQGIPDVPVVKSAICLPIMTNPEGNCMGVIELYRECSERPYDLINLQICNALTAWMGIAIEQNSTKQTLRKEIEIQRQLSILADMYFSGIISFNKIISDFIKVSKSAVNAERGAFYVFREPVQPECDEALWADAFEEGADENGETILYKKRDRQKFTRSKPGIPGYAARTGEVVIIPDAYKDYRFDRKSDSPFFRTRSVVAIPIKNDTGVLGVLLLINSLSNPYFQFEDIVLVQSFSRCLNLICGYYFLETCYTKAQLRLSSKDRLLDFHSKPPQDEINSFKSAIQSETSLPPAFSRFDWDPTGFEDDALKYVGIALCHSDILEATLQSRYLADFLLRVKKSYRPLTYHSFEHGLSVFHFTYYILNRNRNIFTTAEVVAMLLTALCHDVEHMGVTNSFLTLKNDNIYKLYGDFCGEAHRFEFFQFLVTHSELLSELPEQQTETILKIVKKLFLAFDFSIHFQNRQKIINCLNSNSFSWDDPEHRYYAQNMILICADFNINFKSFNLVRKIAANFSRELHKQGDLEKSMGFSPLPMVDRTKHEMIPENQWIFLSVVVVPCLEVLIALFPNLSVLEEPLRETLAKWDELVALRGREIWKINQAIGIEKSSRRPNHKVTLVSTLSSIKTVASETRSEKF